MGGRRLLDGGPQSHDCPEVSVAVLGQGGRGVDGTGFDVVVGPGFLRNTTHALRLPPRAEAELGFSCGHGLLVELSCGHGPRICQLLLCGHGLLVELAGGHGLRIYQLLLCGHVPRDATVATAAVVRTPKGRHGTEGIRQVAD